MAERVGFEPTNGKPVTAFPVLLLRPTRTSLRNHRILPYKARLVNIEISAKEIAFPLSK